MKIEKISINEFGDGNCCPVCGSLKMSKFIQYPLYVEEDNKTGKEIIRDVHGKRINRPSNRLLANLYRSAQRDSQTWCFVCRKCGWTSESFTQ